MDTSFEKSEGNDEWLTPPELIKTLGEFDLDPCAPINRPWNIAKEHYTKEDNGLIKQWHGRVFCNPPYGTELEKWLKKCTEYKNVIALTFARTETKTFHNYVWGKATGIIFIKGRIRFYKVSGDIGGTSGSPSILISYDEYNAIKLKDSGLGYFIKLQPQIIRERV